MLETLRIKNIAIIDSAEIHFKEGLNILSGETGAGKSIILDSISLLLGGRASAEMIRAGCPEGTVEGIFDTVDIAWMRPRLEKLGFDAESDELLVKRTVHHAGKHRIYINGQLATLSNLQEVCDGLIDLCGQHEHHSLLKPQRQLDLLDQYASMTEAVKSFAASFSMMKDLSAELKTLKESESERIRKLDFLSFQIAELQDAGVNEGEDLKLQAEKQLLQSAEARIQAAESAREILEDEENGTMNALRAAAIRLRLLSQLDEKTAGIREAAERAIAEVEEVAIALNRYLGSTETDPSRLETVQERLSLLADLKKKYGPSIHDILETLPRLQAEAATLEKSETRLNELAASLESAEAETRKQGKKLSLARKKAADLLARSVTEELKDLKMVDAKFWIELHHKESLAEWSMSGGDAIRFLVQPNLGESAGPLGKIASGGELSRLMLAVRRIISDRGGIGVYLFDEIDAGIGGNTAFEVGKKLKSVAHYNQVICITHLPQIASFADHHWAVRKSVQSKRTVTEVAELGNEDRKEELARMLGGPQLTKKSLGNAAELLDLAR